MWIRGGNARCKQRELQIIATIHRQFFDTFRIDRGRRSRRSGINRRRLLCHINRLRHSSGIERDIQKNRASQRDRHGRVHIGSEAWHSSIDLVVPDGKCYESVAAVFCRRHLPCLIRAQIPRDDESIRQHSTCRITDCTVKVSGRWRTLDSIRQRDSRNDKSDAAETA